MFCGFGGCAVKLATPNVYMCNVFNSYTSLLLIGRLSFISGYLQSLILWSFCNCEKEGKNSTLLYTLGLQ